ncbi:hypothetical protein VTO42DRAFT_7610 [Malbranchea cinnamomea]
MATSRAANILESISGHRDNAVTQQDVSNPANRPQEWGAESGETMKALVWEGKHKVQLVDAPKPGIIEDSDVILRVTGTTVCGSDLHLYNGVIPQLQTGDILGHEFCGRVDAVGPNVRNLKPGQRVVASFQIACGECRNCKQQRTAHCERANANKTMNNLYGGHAGGIFGYSHLLGGFAGGQAEFVRVPWGEQNLLPLPDNVPDEKGLYLSDVLCTAWHCVVDTGVKEGDVVAVWGGGPIGQMVCEMSFINGAKRVILVDGANGAWRLEFVKSKVPRLETLDYSTLARGESVPSKLKEMTDGVGPDVCLECAGGEYAKGWLHKIETAVGAEMDTSELVNEMLTAVRTFGTCGIIADYMGYTNHFNIGALMERGIRLIGNGQAPVQRYWKQILQMVQDGKLDPLHMVTHRIKLDEMEAAYRKFHARDKGVQKLFVQTRFSDPHSVGPQLSSFADE